MGLFQPKSNYGKSQLIVNVAALLAVLINILIPGITKAQFGDSSTVFALNKAKDEVVLRETPEGRLFYPEVELPDKRIKAVITAYTSTVGQTDGSPFLAASGEKVYDGMIAANGLPFGTQIKIPSLYGDKIFTVHDRMNSRYGFGRMDIWLDTTQAEAKKFGVKRVVVEIYYPHQEKELAMATK